MRYRLRTLITASAATALLLGGAAPGHTTPLPVEATGTGTTITHQVGYDGRDLFRGLMLGYGPIADQYPHLTPDIGTPTPEQAREAEQLIDTVHKLDPTILDRFPTDITSPNHNSPPTAPPASRARCRPLPCPTPSTCPRFPHQSSTGTTPTWPW